MVLISIACNSLSFQVSSYLDIDRSQKKIYFGQLLGMADNISLTLGQSGYNVYKYVPYGPIHEVLPYLLRRAEENSNMLGGTRKEYDLISRECQRRFLMWK